ncbi:hypothetical protein ET445_09625 [Agromyces protaetiae]|uniref:Uncharacterized protein n=1 Tax=Agromyces protaetiae TaxID=2509455 RepID=A0A4P6FBD4_9MICO|nr:hypothetical protein [Agromyces protaetiae]QAY73560.1 hypothetical protein ET445_09625 [Agromyces protaetiae]
MDVLAVLAMIAFAGAFVGSSVLAGDGFALGRRAADLERRDPGRAEALRRAGLISDLRGSGLGDEAFGPVCSPSRRSALDVARVRSGDDDPRHETPAEAAPDLPVTVVALASGSHVAMPPAPWHPTKRRRRVRAKRPATSERTR